MDKYPRGLADEQDDLNLYISNTVKDTFVLSMAQMMTNRQDTKLVQSRDEWYMQIL